MQTGQNMLLGEEDIRILFEDSQLFPVERDQDQKEQQYLDFRRKFQSVVEGFGCESEAEFLFGKQKRCNPTELAFVVFFQSIRHWFSRFSDKETFMMEAFSQWESSFYESLSQLFGVIALEELENLVGKMTSPTRVWMDTVALPAICDGRLFCIMALKYPIFGRQIIEYVYRQIIHLEEIIHALQEELEPAWKAFFGDKPVPKVQTVKASASDRHNGGKCVHVVVFEDGSRIIYKPHHASLDKAFQMWLSWMSKTAGERNFLLPLPVETEDGSFSEFIPNTPLEKKEDAAEYFRRAGFLMGAVYLLKGNDLHAENIIACGNEPVIVDLETMVVPEGCLVYRITGGRNDYSVNSMALLPFMLSLPGFREAKYAGLCNQVPGAANLPIFEGKPVPGNEYAEEICIGFEKALQMFILHKKTAEELLVELFDGCTVRMVIRPTYSYVRILTGLCGRNPQSDKACYKALVARKLFQVNEYFSQEECARILLEEEKALDRLDIPFFEETVDKAMLKNLNQGWDRIDGNLIAVEEARIRFSLAGIRPDTSTTIAAKPCDTSSECIEKNLKRLADSLIWFLDLSAHCAVVTREQNQFLLSDIPMAAVSLLEGNLGTLIALGAYRLVFGSSPALDTNIEKTVEKLMDPVIAAPALTARELGIADGAAGYVLGCRMCYEMGIISAPEFTQSLKYISSIAKDELLLRYGEAGLLYGNAGMLYAISRIPKAFRTPQLQLLHDQVWRTVTSWQDYKGCSEIDIISRVKKEMIHSPSWDKITEDNLKPTGNNSLRFGNSGKLYMATEALMQREDPGIKAQADALYRFLSSQDHIVPGVGIPDGCIEIGLFHGMPGVLYSVCRYMRPDLIPAI